MVPISLLILLTLAGCEASSFRQKTIGVEKNNAPNARQDTKPEKATLINKEKTTEPKKITVVEVHDSARPGWKTLIDKENGYSFVYPKDWVLDDEMAVTKREEKIITPFQLTNFINNADKAYLFEGDISFLLNIYESAIPLKDWFEKYGDFSKAGIKKEIARIKECCEKNVGEKDFEATVQETNKDGTVGIVSYGKIPVLEEGLPTTSKSYIYQKNNKIYRFGFVTPTGARDKELIKIFDEIMDSLKFN